MKVAVVVFIGCSRRRWVWVKRESWRSSKYEIRWDPQTSDMWIVILCDFDTTVVLFVSQEMD